MALGFFAMILGLETLVVDQVVVTHNRRLARMVSGQSADRPGSPGWLNPSNGSPFQNVGFQQGAAGSAGSGRIFQTRDWMPWSLLAAGAILTMYTYSLPERKGGGGGD